jgi:ABC-2 type transport system permease protein
VTFGRRETAALLYKELGQVRRSRGALISASLLSLLMIVVVPGFQLAAILATGRQVLASVPLPGLARFDDPRELFVQLMLPTFVALAGVMVPSIAAVHTIVVERERRTIELLVALPVRVGDILLAKLLANLALAAATLGPLVLVDLTALGWLGLATPAYVASVCLLLVGALGCSVGLSLLVALLARDFRTANNLNGILLGPTIGLVLAVLIFVPADVHLAVLAGLLVAIGVGAVAAGLRWLTFERYLA